MVLIVAIYLFQIQPYVSYSGWTYNMLKSVKNLCCTVSYLTLFV